ncbi:hypothetical protein [Salipiger sp. PrR002]|uniref:hypothetical protein n=1 Tax=Salipiger sp. PrR002 TaxID=2706489 RepID=UPI0013B76E62|nr:hypothetical protein [Salipiger sp. PrR002]NDV99371.1 hypothetical protein [Salipiger sp. PrR002]NDW55857.1 hypothetical protein [Salipiger sp. PrR004]
MTCPKLYATAGAFILLASSALGQTTEETAESLMDRLDGVAPPAVLQNSTLLSPTESGEMQVLREGTNGWTCMYPGTNPMCADGGAMSFLQSWMKNEDPPDTLGFVYMLLGDEGASNTDPYAEGETADNNWVVTGPHVMLLGSGAQPLLESYPTDVPKDAGQPWVMWPGTPYAHLMLPTH